jgi:hypothetical protein
LASLPITVGLVAVLTRDADRHLTGSAKRLLEEEAEGISAVIDRWFFERRGDMDVISTLVEARLGERNLRRLMQRAEAVYGAYDVIQVSDLTGRPLAASNAGTLDPGDRNGSAKRPPVNPY